MKEVTKKSALKEQEGIEAPEIFSKLSVDKIVGFRKIQPSAKELISGILYSKFKLLPPIFSNNNA